MNPANRINTKRYGSATPRPQLRPCVYCASAQPPGSYKQHLVTAHSDLLFHCEECDSFVDRKDFILHMSLHAVQYTTQDFKRTKCKKKTEENISKNPSPVLPAPAPKCSPKTEGKPVNKTEAKPLTKTENKKPPVVVKTKTTVQENEFSDHSDMDGFGPLPESVFEAIEDSQDSQHLEDNTSHTPENGRLSESNISSQPENNSLTRNPVVCLENNNCSVVIEPININDCAQMNIAIKNSNINILNNNLALPTKENAPKSIVVSDNHTNEDRKNRKKIRQCPFCPKQYTASSSYFYHLKYSHKGSKEHECEVCGKKFGTRSCLAQHMATHTDQYEFQCKHCQKQFKSNASLYIHEESHNRKKSWACSQCHTSFRWKTHLKRHMKRHAAEKGYICTTCGCGFSIRCDLLRHVRTHTAGNFTCDKCGLRFAQLRYLKVHTTKQHSANISTQSTTC